MGQCESSVGNEGGWLSTAQLRGGGRLIKVLRHGQIVDELLKLHDAWWAPYLAQADIVLLNIGHHYHNVDASFGRYPRFARLASKNLEAQMAPHAQLIFKTTNIGHYACENASRPLRSRTEAWQQLTSSNSDIWAW